MMHQASCWGPGTLPGLRKEASLANSHRAVAAFWRTLTLSACRLDPSSLPCMNYESLGQDFLFLCNSFQACESDAEPFFFY